MILTIPRSNVLRWVDESQTSAPFNHDNRLLQAQGRVYDNVHPYTQKFSIGDDILIQFVSDYQTLSIQLYDCFDTLVSTLTPSNVHQINDDLSVFEQVINTSLLGGIYYARLTASRPGWNTLSFRTDYFSISNYSDYPLIQWRNSDYDGMYYGSAATVFGFRIEADVMKPIYTTENETFESFNSVVVNVSSKTKRQIDFQTDELPAYIWEKIALAIAHKTLKINGIEYVAVGGVEAEELDALRFRVKCKLQQASYEDYETFVETGGGTPPETGVVYSPDKNNPVVYAASETEIYKPY